MKKPILLLSSITLYIFACFAYSHTPYLKPSSFEASGSKLITLDASFAEKFFIPEVSFSKSNFMVHQPNKKNITPDLLHELKSRTVVEHKLEKPGTYRFSTGKRIGKVFKIYQSNGKRHSLKDHKKSFPKSAEKTRFFQAITLAETYVSSGKTSSETLKPHNTGLELEVLTHPNSLFVDDIAKFRVLFDGEPLLQSNVDIYLAKDQFSDNKPHQKLKSDNKGTINFNLKEQGIYLLRVRHQADAPSNAPAPTYSYTYTLTIEVLN